MKESDEGILLHRIPYSESSFIVSVYTRKNGIQKFIFQGAKKKKVPLYPLLSGEITFYKRPDSELGKLTEFLPTLVHTALFYDPIKSMLSFFIADVLTKCLKSEYKDEELFQFLNSVINQINQSDELTHIPVLFLTEFSKHLGICPNITCEKPLYFNIMDGELTDNKPTGDLYYEEDITDAIVAFLQYKTPSNTAKIQRKKTLEAMLHYYRIHIPKFNELTSLEVIDDLLYK